MIAVFNIRSGEGVSVIMIITNREDSPLRSFSFLLLWLNF